MFRPGTFRNVPDCSCSLWLTALGALLAHASVPCADHCIESFHGVLKREIVYLTHFRTRAGAKQRLFQYIELFYNRKRIHSTIGYVPPHRYERMYYSLVQTVS